jgi:hypothetical protein
MENGPFIDGLPINSMVIFRSYVSLPEGSCKGRCSKIWRDASTKGLGLDGLDML